MLLSPSYIVYNNIQTSIVIMPKWRHIQTYSIADTTSFMMAYQQPVQLLTYYYILSVCTNLQCMYKDLVDKILAIHHCCKYSLIGALWFEHLLPSGGITFQRLITTGSKSLLFFTPAGMNNVLVDIQISYISYILSLGC